MRRALSILAVPALTACSGLAWNTEVASTPASRTAMAASVIPGATTERGFATRWGYPTQKVREGGQTEFIYRDMANLPGWYAPQFGDSHNYVIVTFQYGLATAVRTSDGIDCRGTFPPRPPGMWVDNPATVRLVGGCAPLLTPEEAARKGPIARAWDKLKENWGEAKAQMRGDPPGPGRPGVVEDSYDAGGKAGRAPGDYAARDAAAEGIAGAPVAVGRPPCSEQVITPADGGPPCDPSL